MANWANRILAVVNAFTGRPSPTNVEAAYQVRAPLVNANFQGSALAVAFCQALGTECADNGSTAILCKLVLLAGRFVAGDRVTVIEDRPTGRVWCAVCTAGIGVPPNVEFADAQLQDATLSGTADYNTIRADLLIVETAPLDKFVWPKQAILVGGRHGLTGTVIPWQYGNTQTIEAKLLAAVGPAGADTEVQFNDAGNMAGAAALTYDKTNGCAAVGTGNVFGGGALSLAVGASNNLGGDDSLAVGNSNAIAAGATNSLAVGQDNDVTVNGKHGAVFGRDGSLSRAQQVAVSTVKLATEGDSQHTMGLPRAISTTDVNPHLIASESLEAGKTYTVQGSVAARTAAGVSAGWTFTGVVENTAGTSRDIAAIVPLKVADGGAAAWTLAVATNVGTDTLDVTVQDPGGATIHWMLNLVLTEVGL